RQPNNLLAVEYLRAIRALGAQLTPLAYPRTSGVSASSIRAAMRRGGEDARAGIPEAARGIFGDTPPMLRESLEIALLSRLRRMSLAELQGIAGGGDGVAERAERAIRTAPSLDALEAEIKTKRYQLSRVRRFLLAAALGLAAEGDSAPPYIRVLAVNGTGRGLLRQISRAAAIPVVTKPANVRQACGAPEVLRAMELEADATDFYVLGYSETRRRAAGSEWRGAVTVKP
ncbi:MAG: nucleotidyltransferase family protein, partial [Oscillospiraceae bacterium]|nr:nucleotidyltransferase family protein [Oscillospiraceae bacterium]